MLSFPLPLPILLSYNHYCPTTLAPVSTSRDSQEIEMEKAALPSINELFPEHLMPQRKRHSRSSSASPYHSPPYLTKAFVPSSTQSSPRFAAEMPQGHVYSVSRPDPSTMNYSSSSKSGAYCPRPTHAGSGSTRPHVNSSRSGHGNSQRGESPDSPSRSRSHPGAQVRVTPEEPDAMISEDSDEPGNDIREGSSTMVHRNDQTKRHICPTCSKRFNRPSSLRIHVNTHTGATPFRCPFPDCGREFNVNSNMRRHYRNHTGTDIPPPVPNTRDTEYGQFIHHNIPGPAAPHHRDHRSTSSSIPCPSSLSRPASLSRPGSSSTLTSKSAPAHEYQWKPPRLSRARFSDDEADVDDVDSISDSEPESSKSKSVVARPAAAQGPHIPPRRRSRSYRRVMVYVPVYDDDVDVDDMDIAMEAARQYSISDRRHGEALDGRDSWRHSPPQAPRASRDHRGQRYSPYSHSAERTTAMAY